MGESDGLANDPVLTLRALNVVQRPRPRGFYGLARALASPEGTLIAFRLARYDKDRASELVKRLYGQRTSSQAGSTCTGGRGSWTRSPA